MFQVERIRVVFEYDDTTPAYMLGHFTAERPAKNLLQLGLAFDRGADAIARGEPRYFVSSLPGRMAEAQGINVFEIASADFVDKETARSHFERAETYGEDWAFMSIKAEADVQWQYSPRYPLRSQTFSSAGVRNLESDSDQEDVEQAVSAELSDLRSTLEAFSLCVSNEEWEALVAEKQTVERTVPARD
jgi:hypothetical protein